MRHPGYGVALSAALGTLACGGGGAPAHAPGPGAPSGAVTLVVAGAKVYGAPPGADAVAVSGASIVAVGSSDALRPKCAPPCVVVEAAGGFLMPGFHDAHVHLYGAGREASQLVVRGRALAPIQAAVTAYAKEHPELPWIFGRGWEFDGSGTLPTSADLDAVESRRPVALADHSGHNLWVNTAALAAAGVDARTPDVPGGRIVRGANGAPTGVFIDGAKAMFLGRMPKDSEADMERWILKGQEIALGAGITSAQGGPVSLAMARAYKSLDDAGRLTQRAFLWAPLGVSDSQLQEWLQFASGLPKDGHVHVVAFKGFLDGTFAAKTSAMIAPYANAPGETGQLYFPPGELARLVVRANRAGFPVALHAEGDRAVREALDAFEASKTALHHGLVNRVEHAVVVDPKDVPRFAQLGVAASVHPMWLATSSAQSRIFRVAGPTRIGETYAFRTLEAAGAMLLFGSDYPSGVEIDPIVGLSGAIRRQLKNGEIFALNEAVDPDAAMRASTSSPAAAIGMGDRLGKLAPGQLADMILLAGDPREARSRADAPITRMWIGGRDVPVR